MDTTEGTLLAEMLDFFRLWQLCPVRVEHEVVQLLGLRGPWRHQVCRDVDCLCHRSYGPIRVFS